MRSRATPRIPRPLYSFRSNALVPSSKIVTLSYVETVAVDPASDALAVYQFYANDIRAPNITSPSSHQPLGFDQMMALYNHWVVVGSKITITVSTSVDDTNDGTFLWGVALLDDTTSLSSANTYAEQENSISRLHGSYQAENNTLSTTYSAKRFFGTGPRSNVNLQGTASAGVADNAIYHIYCQSVGGLNLAAVYYHVKLSYVVLLTERKDLVGS